jgi:hypothetical protein
MGPFSVTFSAPTHGWIDLSLCVGPERFVVAMSYTPFDSLGELASAVLAGVGSPASSGLARLNAEPDRFDVHVDPTSSDEIEIRVLHVSRNATPSCVFSFRGPRQRVGRTWFRAFRSLHSRFEASHWQHPFPGKLVDALEVATRPTARFP